MSYLDHPVTTVFTSWRHLQPVFERSSPPVPAGSRDPTNSTAYMGFGLHRADFDIIFVDIRRKTPDELPRPPGDHGVASWSF